MKQLFVVHWSNLMTNENHPITPSLELLKHWEEQHFDEGENYDVMLIQAYQAGADQELEACCEWLVVDDWKSVSKNLRAARRPKPPSLKEQALFAIDTAVADGRLSSDVSNVVRRALEALPND
jgi:hypothetical protein